mmetsp:Transcript_37805/g.49754  ORF Transcript_37805/g.49754 Transcript_37805/m.49754 type:complete len:110 (+) Transcript_37805:899-1228(+)
MSLSSPNTTVQCTRPVTDEVCLLQQGILQISFALFQFLQTSQKNTGCKEESPCFHSLMISNSKLSGSYIVLSLFVWSLQLLHCVHKVFSNFYVFFFSFSKVVINFVFLC